MCPSPILSYTKLMSLLLEVKFKEVTLDGDFEATDCSTVFDGEWEGVPQSRTCNGKRTLPVDLPNASILKLEVLR